MAIDPTALPQEPATEPEEVAGIDTTTDEGTAAPAAATDDAYWEWLSQQDPDTLLQRHAKLKDHYEGTTGRRAQEQAQRLAAQREATIRSQVAYEQEQARLVALAREEAEYSPFAKQYLGQQQQAVSRDQQIREMQQAAANLDANLLHPLGQKLSEQAQREILGKIQSGAYGTDWYGSRRAYAEDVLEHYANEVADRKVGETKAEYEKRLKVVDAARDKEALGTGDDETVDTGGGTSGGGGITPQRWVSASAEQRTKWKQENPDAVNAMWARAAKGR